MRDPKITDLDHLAICSPEKVSGLYVTVNNSLVMDCVLRRKGVSRLARGDEDAMKLTIFEAEDNIAAYSSTLVHLQYRLILLIAPLNFSSA
jgi:hypothetical protein